MIKLNPDVLKGKAAIDYYINLHDFKIYVYSEHNDIPNLSLSKNILDCDVEFHFPDRVLTLADLKELTKLQEMAEKLGYDLVKKSEC